MSVKSFDNSDIKTNSQNSNYEFGYVAPLTYMESGSFAIELNDKLISQITERSTNDPVMYVGIKETAPGSGQSNLIFNPPPNVSLIKIIVTKTPSDNLSFEIDKNMVKTLFPGKTRNNEVEDCKSSVSIDVKKSSSSQFDNVRSKKQKNLKVINEYGNLAIEIKNNANKNEIKMNLECDTTAVEKIKRNQLLSSQTGKDIALNTKRYNEGISLLNSENTNIDQIRELHTLYNNHVETINIKIYGENGVIASTNADVTKTSSGNIALELKNISSVGEISSKNKDRPVLLERSLSGMYKLFLERTRNIKAPNSVLRKTLAGSVLVIITEPVMKSVSCSNYHAVTSNPKLFKVRTKGNHIGNIALHKAVLKLTPSGNYILVLDKEFELQHTNTIKKTLEETECYVELTKTDSDTIILDFDDNNDEQNSHKQNAVLVKSPSGHLKIYVNGPNFENVSKGISISRLIKAESLEEFLVKPLARESKKPKDASIQLDIKYTSDTNLNEKIRVKFQDRKGLFAGQSAMLKRTSSGKYAVILSKESKKTLANDLRNYLAHSSQDRIPITKNYEGEITIVLDAESESKGQYGSLKITPSGNIYVLVQESVIQEMIKNNTNKQTCADLGSKHLIRKIMHPEDKGVATNCNARPEDGLCDESKCVCEKIKDKAKKNFSGKEEKLELIKQKCGISLKTKKATKISSEEGRYSPNCKENCCTLKKRNVSPHIVIKPFDCNNEEKRPNVNNQCYYVFESICPLHKNRYDTMSNEILEISGLCKYPDIRDSSDSSIKDIDQPDSTCYQESSKSDEWDSLTFLPPQLPPFLRNITF